MVHRMFHIALLAAALTFSASAARASLVFDFSFNDPDFVNDVSGTVTGEIVGLQDNATGPATQLLITSIPPGYNPGTFGALPVDVTLWSDQVSNSFTVSGGNVVSASFNAIDTDGSTFSNQLFLSLGVGSSSGHLVNDDLADRTTFETIATDLSITPTSSVPEPATFALFAIALAGLKLSRRKQA